MPSTATTPGTVTRETTPPDPVLDRPRGRHRKPRPRRVLFAVGGLALAAGALSLLRIASHSSGTAGSVEATDIDPNTADPAANGETLRDDSGTEAEAGTGAGRPPTARAPHSSPATPAATGPQDTARAPASGPHGPPGPQRQKGSAASAGGAAAPAGPAGITGPAADAVGPAPAHPLPRPSEALQGTRPVVTTPPAGAGLQPAVPQPPAATPPVSPRNPARPGTGLCVPVVGLCFDGFKASEENEGTTAR